MWSLAAHPFVPAHTLRPWNGSMETPCLLAVTWWGMETNGEGR